jgi:hypothetical protein
MTTPNDLRTRELFRQRRSLQRQDTVVFYLVAIGVWLLLFGLAWLAILVWKR